MNINVNFDELDELRKVSENNKNYLEDEINKLLSSIERLQKIWQGEDFDRFYDNAYNYISRMKVLCEFMETTNKFIKEVGNSYQDQDEEFSNSLKEEEAKLDEKNNNNRL